MTTVLIVSKYPLFGQGVEHLLSRDADITVVGLDTDVEQAAQHVNALQPDVVMLDSSDPNRNPAPILVQILRWKQPAIIVGLNLADNVACVCSVEHAMVNKVSDLLDIVRPAVSAMRAEVDDARV